VFLWQGHVPILVVQADLSEWLQVNVSSLPPLLLLFFGVCGVLNA
jgi:hypothetical protein